MVRQDKPNDGRKVRENRLWSAHPKGAEPRKGAYGTVGQMHVFAPDEEGFGACFRQAAGYHYYPYQCRLDYPFLRRWS